MRASVRRGGREQTLDIRRSFQDTRAPNPFFAFVDSGTQATSNTRVVKSQMTQIVAKLATRVPLPEFHDSTFQELREFFQGPCVLGIHAMQDTLAGTLQQSLVGKFQSSVNQERVIDTSLTSTVSTPLFELVFAKL